MSDYWRQDDMSRKETFMVVILICLLLVFFEAKFVTLVTTSPGVIRVPTDKLTIQEAINAASPGDIIQVASSSRMYYENLIVNKRISLVGEDPATTILDGGGIGSVITISASNVMVTGFTIQHAGVYPNSGIFLFGSNNTVINNNVIIENAYCGLELKETSNHNIIEGNIIANNSIGCVIYSPNNMFYRNSFINNTTIHVSVFEATNWDNGAEGNYWSDYNGMDADGDGIGDTAYIGVVFDKYPLIESWTLSKVFPVGVHNVIVSSNSTIASFNFNNTLRTISFRMTGPSGWSFFCDVKVPKALLNASTSERWRILLNGTEVYGDVETAEDLSLLHFSGHFSRLEVQIQVVAAEAAKGVDFRLYALTAGIAIAIVATIFFIRMKKQSKGEKSKVR